MVELFVGGLIVGIMNAIAGGGMLLGFPLLLAAGLSPLAANVTGNLVILPGQLSSAFGYRRYIRQLPPRYFILLFPCLVGAAIGALILRNTSSVRFAELVPVLLILAVGLFALQPLLHFHLHRHISERRTDLVTLIVIATGLLPVAMYGGYFGPGFGFIMLAFLGFTKLRETHLMNAVKNLGAAAIAGVSLLCLYSTHLIDWRHGLVMAVGSTLGGYLGARTAQHFSSHAVRGLVIVVGIGAAIYCGLRAY